MTPEQIKLLKEIDNQPRTCVKCGTTAPGVYRLCYTCREDLTPDEQQEEIAAACESLANSVERLDRFYDKLTDILSQEPEPPQEPLLP